MKHIIYLNNREELNNLLESNRDCVLYIKDTKELIYNKKYKTIGEISDYNKLTINTDDIESGDYTIEYVDENAKKLSSWINISNFTI